MVVVVMACLAIVFAKRILNTVVGSRDMMNDTLFNKSLQGPINSYPVKSCLDVFFNIGVGQGTAAVDKQFKYFFPSGRNA